MSEDFPMMDEEDHGIVMHRDVHFSGSFDEMIRYYEDEGVGAEESFFTDRIRLLQQMEKEAGVDFHSTILTPFEQKKIEKARAAYMRLRETYESKTATDSQKAIIDMILSEEIDPIEEIEHVASFGRSVAELLLAIVVEEECYDPLFPGYGYAPGRAAIALGLIKYDKAIDKIFHAIEIEHTRVEDDFLTAFSKYGESAENYILNELKQRPLTRKTGNALLIASVINPSPEIAKEALAILSEDVSDEMIAYLLTLCIGLPKDFHKSFEKVYLEKGLDEKFSDDIDFVRSQWVNK